MNTNSPMINSKSPFSGQKQSLRWRLPLLLGFSLLAMMIVTAVIVLYFVYNTEVKAGQFRQNEASLHASETINTFLQNTENHLYFINMLESDYLEAQPNTIMSILEANPAFLEIVYLDKNGNVVASAAEDNPLLSNLFTNTQSSWFSEASQGKPYFSKVNISAFDEPYLIMSLPAMEGGVVAARISMNVLWDVVSDIRYGETGVSSYIITQDGEILGHADAQIPLANISINGRPELEALLTEPNFEWSGRYENFEGLPVVGTSRIIPETEWIVITELSQIEASKNTRAALIRLSLSMILIATLVILISIRYLQRLFIQPMEDLRDGVERIGQIDLGHRIQITREDEVGQVARSFNEMAERLGQREELLDLKTNSLVTEVADRKLAQEALKQAHDQLELRVAERTEALEKSNKNLQTEISERKLAEEKIQASLEEKEVLLKEIHHRVKNNLQVIASILNLQSGYIEDQRALEIFQDSQNRVEAMAAIHEKLYRSDNLAKIDFTDYINDLTGSLFSTYDNRVTDVSVSIESDDVWLGVDTAIPCGLILNELVSNALKHAFTDGRVGHIKIHFRKAPDGRMCLCVNDNGVGFPAQLDFRNTVSLGLQLVNTLAKQLNGTIELQNGNGTTFHLEFFALSEGAAQ